MPSDDVAYLRVKIETANVTTHVYHVDVEDVDRGTDKATLRMDDPGSTSSDALQEGMHVEVELGWETEHALVFEGIVKQVRAVAQGTHGVEVVAYDLSARMQTQPPELNRQHVGGLDKILEAIVKRHNIPFGSVKIDPMPTWTKEKPLLQGNRTDWQMIQDLAEEYRSRAFVEVNATPEDSEEIRKRGGQARFYFASEKVLLEQKPMGRLLHCRGMGSLLEFRYERVASGASPSTSTTVTNPDTGEADVNAGPPTARGPEPGVLPERSKRAAEVLGPGRADDHKAGVQMAADAKVKPDDLRAKKTAAGLPSDPELAKRVIEQDRTRALGFHGTGLAMGTVFLRAKGAVEIDGLATWTAGAWYVTRVNHVVERETLNKRTRLTYRTRFTATR